jgi:hypothetical protein
LRFSGHVNIPTLDILGLTDKQKEVLDAFMRQAARAYVRAAISKIPIQTGMARGSYLNIGRFLKVAIPLAGASNYRIRSRHGKSYKEKNFWYYPPGGGRRLPKTPETGANLTAFKLGPVQKSNGIAYEFTVNSKVFHLTLEDQIGVKSPSAPWQSTQAGREAWLTHMKGLKKRLPKIKDYISNTTISFGRGSGDLTKTYGRLRIRKNESG